MKKNIIVGQSGGPTAVINSSLYGVVSEGYKQSDVIGEVYGMVNGMEGFLANRVMDMRSMYTSGDLELLKTTPGAFLGSCRFKLPSEISDPVFPEIFKKFEEYNIGYFFYIGGNDSMDTVSKLTQYAREHQSDIKILGIPKTVDNDLVETDHTPGFGSAAKFVATTVREIAIDASVYDNKPSVTIVEIMGRHAGWLTAASAMARKFEGDNPTRIYLPEVAFDLDKMIEQLKEDLEKGNNPVICISEGIHDDKGTFICEYDNSVGVDSFGHKMLAGSGKYLENYIRDKLNIKVRSVELNVSQRCSSSCLSETDVKEAVQAGVFGVDSALEGETGKMVGFERVSDSPYEIACKTKDVLEICNKEKAFPDEWISREGSDITDDFKTYVSPLIAGDVLVPSEGGLPMFAYRK